MADKEETSPIDLETLKYVSEVASMPSRIELSDRLPLHLQDHNIAALREEYAETQTRRSGCCGPPLRPVLTEKQDSEAPEKSKMFSSDTASTRGINETQDLQGRSSRVERTEPINDKTLSVRPACTQPLVAAGSHLLSRLRTLWSKLATLTLDALSIMDDPSSSG